MKHKLLVLMSFLLLLLGSANVLDCHCNAINGCANEPNHSSTDICTGDSEDTSDCCANCGFEDSSLTVIDSQTIGETDSYYVAPRPIIMSQTPLPERIASAALNCRPPPLSGVKWQISHCTWLI